MKFYEKTIGYVRPREKAGFKTTDFESGETNPC